MKLQFQQKSKSKRNKNVKNCVRSDQKNINVYKETFLKIKSKRNEGFIFLDLKKRKNETLTSAVLPAKNI